MSGHNLAQIVGTAIGYYFGGPFGGAIGGLIGGAVVPEEVPDQIGPRLSDLRPQSSSYGRPISVVWGDGIGVSGNVIWAPNLIEINDRGNFTYYANFAVLVCEGPRYINRIWAGPDKQLIWDGSRLFGGNMFSAVYIHTGTDTQMPNSWIEALEGAGNVPAWRGWTYVVFQVIPLAAFQNTIPSLLFEVMESPPAAVFRDDFNGSGSFLNRVPDGPHGGLTWVDDFNSSIGVISGGQLTTMGLPGSIMNAHALLTSAPTDQYIEAGVVADYRDAGSGLLMRYDAATARYIGVYFGSYDDTQVTVRVVVSTGGETDLHAGLHTVPDGHNYTIRLESQGSAVRLYLNGALVWSGTQTSVTTSTNVIRYMDSYTGYRRIEYIASGSINSSTSTLAHVVSDLCQRAGLTTDQYNVSQLAGDTVDGYMLNNQISVRSAIDALRNVYYFDAVETFDTLTEIGPRGIVRFVKRGHPAVRTIDDFDLAAATSGSDAPEPLSITRTMDNELPNQVDVNYINRATKYAIANKFQRRLTGDSQQQLTMDLPLVLSDAKAQEVANTNLYIAQQQRLSFEFTLSNKHADLEPTDVIVVKNLGMRITQIDDSQGVRKITAIRDASHYYTPHVVVTETLPAPGSDTVTTYPDTTLELM